MNTFCNQQSDTTSIWILNRMIWFGFVACTYCRALIYWKWKITPTSRLRGGCHRLVSRHICDVLCTKCDIRAMATHRCCDCLTHTVRISTEKQSVDFDFNFWIWNGIRLAVQSTCSDSLNQPMLKPLKPLNLLLNLKVLRFRAHSRRDSAFHLRIASKWIKFAYKALPIFNLCWTSRQQIIV